MLFDDNILILKFDDFNKAFITKVEQEEKVKRKKYFLML